MLLAGLTMMSDGFNAGPIVGTNFLILCILKYPICNVEYDGKFNAQTVSVSTFSILGKDNRLRLTMESNCVKWLCLH
ncbi:hypothetical protein RRG08_066308 [Elysia crispata]|uniref:Uncharacterized protein n=1 Tax=Elysia crispata TaxID=231223 RepID=A0AAE1AML9_9GAST|nr:hypothetical protein RRG08_066308 [Elysia crispata]